MDHFSLPAAYTVSGFCDWAGISRSKVYDEAAKGRLPIRKVGKRALILRADAEEWLASLPMWEAYKPTSTKN